MSMGINPGASFDGHLTALRELRPGHVAELVTEQRERERHEADFAVIRDHRSKIVHEEEMAKLAASASRYLPPSRLSPMLRQAPWQDHPLAAVSMAGKQYSAIEAGSRASFDERADYVARLQSKLGL